MTVRFATEADAGRLLVVYAQYIDTSVTFEYDLPAEAEFAARIRDITESWPYLICEEGGKTAGYAYAHLARERKAYGWYVELSIYLDRSRTGQGLGKRLYGLLLDILRAQGVRTAMGCVTLPNPASEALHAALGFDRAGVSRSAGYKNGAWHDVAWFEKPLAPYDVPPSPTVPVRDLGRELVTGLMKKYFP